MFPLSLILTLKQKSFLRENFIWYYCIQCLRKSKPFACIFPCIFYGKHAFCSLCPIPVLLWLLLREKKGGEKNASFS
ncbi:hypothetical protein B4096_3275 [Heyndrickxia coagulans]|nr:hypothetical protein B4096_3275 [Heyndrickxia coagulans]